VVAHEAFTGELLQFFQLTLEACGNLRVHPRAGGEKPDHYRLVRAFAHGLTEKGGIAFVEHIDDAVIIDVVTAFFEVPTASGASGDFLCDRLAARRTEFHTQFLHRTG
jgi:hypothetical protein